MDHRGTPAAECKGSRRYPWQRNLSRHGDQSRHAIESKYLAPPVREDGVAAPVPIDRRVFPFSPQPILSRPSGWMHVCAQRDSSTVSVTHWPSEAKAFRIEVSA